MWLAMLSPETLTLIAVVVLLVGVPILVVAVIAIVSGVLQHDIDERVAERTEEEAVDRDAIEDRN